MEEPSCIVCLCELRTTPPTESPDSATQLKQLGPSTSSDSSFPSNHIQDHDGAVARVLPCEHDFHQSCLRPWVEKANSCPICRQPFNQVDLRSYLGGPCVYSYGVQDKKQIEEVDGPLVFMDDLFEDPVETLCVVCNGNGRPGAFMQCEGCSANYHPSCAGSRTPRRGSWYCSFCYDEGLGQDPSSRPRGRARPQPAWMQAARSRQTGGDHREWNRLWQTVHRGTNIDLDFPFSDDGDEASERTEAERQEFQEWNRRFQIAERQVGVGPAQAILQAREARNGRRASPQEAGESQDEIRAWNAFDKARQLLDQPESTNTTNKRKTAPASPAEPNQDSEPTRTLKKPRTRKIQNTNEQTPETNGESSSAAAPAQPQQNGTSRSSESNGAAPSFLQSLLKEVESGPPAVDRSGTHRLSLAGLNQTSNPSSPGSPGLGSSLASSNHSSPRGRSISPASHRSSRSNSPPPLASRIEPNYSGGAPSRLSYSPVSPVQTSPESKEADGSWPISPNTNGSNGNSPVGNITQPRLSSPGVGSPSRHALSVSAKEEVQKLVRGVLESEWNKQSINRNQYTEINRDVSRKLYEMVGSGEDLTQPDKRQHWVDVAAKEVTNALQVLKPSIKVNQDGG